MATKKATGLFDISDEAVIAAPSTTPVVVDPASCACGAPWRFDPALEGETTGGVHRAGWLVCDGCGATRISRRGAQSGAWKLASSGRSIDVGGGRLRIEGAHDAEAVMRRIARLPDLEAALREIARGDGDAAAVARAALEGGVS